MNRIDFTYTYDSQGYMLYYKGVPIGGAGTLHEPKHWRHKRANCTDNQEYAKMDIANILNGSIPPHMKEALVKAQGK